MGFKEAIFSDIKNVFLNPEEFGEVHTVDGKPMPVIIDGLEVIERSKKQTDQGRIDGIYEKQVVLYVDKKEFGPMPSVGRILQLDNAAYRVSDAINEDGIYSITLGGIKPR